MNESNPKSDPMEKLQHDAKTFAKDVEPECIKIDSLSVYEQYGLAWFVTAHSTAAKLELLYQYKPNCFVDEVVRIQVLLGVLTERACEITGMTVDEFEQAQCDLVEDYFGFLD